MSILWNSSNHTRSAHNVSMQRTKCYYCPHFMITASSGQHVSETRFHIYLEISQLFTKPSVQTYFTLEINRSTISTLQNRRALVLWRKNVLHAQPVFSQDLHLQIIKSNKKRK